MKFTFASLMLLLVHAVMGVPLAAQTVRDTGLAEVEPALAGQSGHVSAQAKVVAHMPAPGGHVWRAAPWQADIIPAGPLQSAMARHYDDSPRHWAMGDRHALDEGKP